MEKQKGKLWGLGFLCATLIMSLSAGVIFAFAQNSYAAPGVNEQINFQGRLYNNLGAGIADGNYNMQFKIYQDGDGQSVNNSTGSPAGSLLWTEEWLNDNSQGVSVINGFFSVQLGSVTPFAGSVDWAQDTLWLSVNIGDTNTSCTPFTSCNPDGEMVPMKRLSATPYALNSKTLNGLTADNFIQLAQGVQTDASNNTSSIFINKTGTGGDFFQLQNAGIDVLTIDNAGDITLGNNADHLISIAEAEAGNDGNTLTVSAGNGGTGAGNAGGDLVLQGGDGGGTDGNGGNISIDAGAATGTGTLGTVEIGGTNAGTVQIGSTDDAITQTINIGNNTTGGSQTDVTIGSTLGASSTTIQAGTGGISLNSDVEASGIINAVGGFEINGTSGATTTCGVGEYLQQQVVQGGITTGGTCTTITAAGSDTFQDIYDNSGAAPIIDLNSTGNGILFRDNVSPIGGNLFAVQDSTGTTDYLSVTASGTSVAGTFSVSGTINGATISGGTLSGGNISGGSLSDTSLTFASTDSTIGLAPGASSTAGGNLTIQAGEGGSGSGSAGGTLALQGGNAGGTNANGGDVAINGGTGTGTGVDGLVILGTPTFKAYGSLQTCSAATMDINQGSVDNNSTILVASDYVGNCVVTLPYPTNTTAGRVVYVTAASTTAYNFTLSVNGGGTGNQVSMRSNTTATMVWNGTAWAAAGASSSTTLQAAYDNTIQSSGGAELIVSATANTRGLTIRDSSTNTVNGTLMSVQSSSAANLLSINSNVTEYASNPGAEAFEGSIAAFPSNTWSSQGTGATVSRNTNTANDSIATGQGSVQVVTTGSANSGARNQIVSPTNSTPTPLALTANNHYNVSFSVRLPAGSGTFANLQVDYSPDGTTTGLVPCTSDINVSINVWTKVNCSFTAPSSGVTSANAVLLRQAGSDSRTFYIDNLSITIAADYNLASDGGVDNAGTFATNWTKATFGGAPGGTLARDTNDGQAASTSAKYTSVPNTAKVGIRNQLAINPIQNTLYRVTVYAKSSVSLSNFMVRYTPTAATANTGTDGNYVDCQDYNTRTVTSSDWTKITCYLQTGATTPDTSFLYFVNETAPGSTYDLAVDTVSITLSDSTTPNVQIGGGINGGPTTLLTLDRAASAPIAGDNDALLGSMYYDTTLGKLQCYEADGWGACGSSPDNIVTISPEYNNAVMHGTGVGTMISDICSDALNINDGSSGQDTICGSNETFNYYKWTSPQASTQSYSIYVTYQLPNTFKEFASGETYVDGRIDHASNASLNYQIYRSNPTTGLTACGGSVSVVTAANTWNRGTANGAADPSACGFSPGDSIVFRITVATRSNANSYVGNLGFTFSNR